MANSASAVSARGRFRLAIFIWASLVIAFGLLLQPELPLSFRQVISPVGLLVAGLAGTASAGFRSWRSESGLRRPWLVLTAAGVIAILGNVWVAVTSADAGASASLVSNVSIAAALVISVIGLLTFPSSRRRGAELAVMILDGLVAGGALVIIVSVIVYADLVDSTGGLVGSDRFFALVVPVLDVALATVAIVLVLRATREDRLMLGLVATGFLLYAGSDLAFAVVGTRDSFHFGTLLDLGWIAGYLTLALAAWVPSTPAPGSGRPGRGMSDSLGTALVFAVLLTAVVVQVAFGADGLRGSRSVVWFVVIAAAGTRQVLLTGDNAALRRGLERRVADQTTDLARLARQNEVLLTSVGDGIYGVDQDGRITFINPSAARALGYSTAELDGRDAHDLFHAPDEDGVPFASADCYIHEAITHGQVTSAEEDVYLRADGTSFAVEVTASPLIDGSEVLGAAIVFRDVTQRKEVDRMKNEFLSIVSHELRTPLTSIVGSLGLIAGGRLGPLPPRMSSLVTIALQSSERLTRLINDLLDLERIESGTQPIESRALEASTLLHAAARQIEGMATSAGIRVEVGSTSGRVYADEDRIMQTLTNLLGNAIKFSHPGGLVHLDSVITRNRVLFRVRDQGRGIPPDKLESVFERFEQVDSSDTRQKGGTGLGLAISRTIIEQHGGTIWAESELGAGTTVVFSLPGLTPTTGDDPGEPSYAPTVLVCDDDPAVVEAFSVLLRTHGYRPIGVTDGASAIEVVSSEHPAAVLLDLMMPGTTGAQVLDAVRGDRSTRGIPVVVVSGLGPGSNTALAEDTQGWLIKPVSEARLVQTVALALGGRERERVVLLVEDDEELAGVLSAMLTAEHLDVRRVASASEAVVAGHEVRPDVIVLDLHLPDGDGGDVVAEFRRRGVLDHTPLIVYSASEVDPGRRRELELGETVFLTKGRSSPDDLTEQVLGLIDAVTTPTAPRETLDETPDEREAPSARTAGTAADEPTGAPAA